MEDDYGYEWETVEGVDYTETTFDTAQVYIERGVEAYTKAHGLDSGRYYGMVDDDGVARIALINHIPVEIYIISKDTGMIVATATIKVKHDNEVIIV